MVTNNSLNAPNVSGTVLTGTGSATYNATTYTNANTASTICSRDSGGSSSFTTIITSPPTSATATSTLGGVTISNPIQNTLGYDILLSGTIAIAVAAGGNLVMGVDTSATPSTGPLTTALTLGGLTYLSYSAVIPKNYYFLLDVSGSITVSSITSVATPL